MEFSRSFNMLGFPDGDLDNYEDSPCHVELTKRLRKTLYYGADPNTDKPSLPVTDIAIEVFQNASPMPCKKVDKHFAAKVSRKSSLSPCAFMVSMMYIDRLKHTNPEYLKTVSSADLFLVTMMLASKYLYDEGEEEEMYNDEWADAAGLDVDTVNEMERDFLSAINWNLFVKPIDFFIFLHRIETRIAFKEGSKRGWFTYTDLSVLLDEETIHNICISVITQTVQIAGMCVLIYGMCTMAILGSSVLISQSAITTAPDVILDIAVIPMQPVLESVCLSTIRYTGTGHAILNNNCHLMLDHRQLVNKSAFTVQDILIVVPLEDFLTTLLHIQYNIVMVLANIIIAVTHVLSQLSTYALTSLMSNMTDVRLHTTDVTILPTLRKKCALTTNITDITKSTTHLPSTWVNSRQQLQTNSFSSPLSDIKPPTIRKLNFTDFSHRFTTLTKIF
ncbi:protein CNPPD1-like [Glandiceps talaboti]